MTTDCAAKHIDIKRYIVKEKIQNHIESIERISTKQVLADPLTKAYRPMCLENTQSTWVYGRAYDFWILRAQKKVCFKIERCIVAVNMMVLTVMMRHALCSNL